MHLPALLPDHVPDAVPFSAGTHWTLLLFDRYGLPMLLLVGVAWAALRAARWIAPRFDKVIDRHQRFLDVLELELGRHGEVLEKVQGTQAQMQDTQSRMLTVLEESQRAATAAAQAAAAAIAAKSAAQEHRDR